MRPDITRDRERDACIITLEFSDLATTPSVLRDDRNKLEQLQTLAGNQGDTEIYANEDDDVAIRLQQINGAIHLEITTSFSVSPLDTGEHVYNKISPEGVKAAVKFLLEKDILEPNAASLLLQNTAKLTPGDAENFVQSGMGHKAGVEPPKLTK